MLVDSFENTPNPLDHIEEIISSHNWDYNRMTDDELVVKIKGKVCNYRLVFIWQENMSALQFCCQYDLAIKAKNIPCTGLALMEINKALWMGHFEVARETLIPSFRHTCLLRGLGHHTAFDSIQDLVDISLAQCERYMPVFDILSNSENADIQTLSLAIMETQGES
jgi:hypothetical protein